ncbi:MAG: hypothetical protein PHG23_02810 [Candidatus Pacebacteria bacterium]|nr:hypothetical protein [Candidatus Paceibacterota bacterium]
MGVFANGENQKLFQIAIARFPCKEGLELFNKNYFRETESSGKPIVAVPDTIINSIRPGAIEMD